MYARTDISRCLISVYKTIRLWSRMTIQTEAVLGGSDVASFRGLGCLGQKLATKEPSTVLFEYLMWVAAASFVSASFFRLIFWIPPLLSVLFSSLQVQP